MSSQPIAIVGLGCRFPGGETPAEFWRLLSRGESAVGEVPRERWDLAEWYDENSTAPGKMSTRWGGFLRAIDGFDAGFFGIAPREALHMDPQQRLMLEVTWEALEDAGIVPRQLAGSSTGVFIGFGSLEYSLTQLRRPTTVDGYTQTGYYPCIIANRISYAFDFRGPSLSLDTACSSSLVAIQLACRSLRCGESTLALAGGVNLMIDPVTTVGFSKLSAMSPDGRCHTFDAAANGYVRGEGAGVLILKQLAAAQADGDHIYAVIRGEAVNQDGRTNGLTAPNRWSQEAVLRAAYRQAGVAPAEVQYVEAHGTGTLLGDPIEAMALGAVLGEGRSPGEKCAVGSLKTNIGHLEAAAGVASTIKVALSLQQRQIPPQLNFDTPNPHIPFEELPLRVQTALTPWPTSSRPPLAGISSFGFGGTNAHLVLEAAPEIAVTADVESPARRRGRQLLPISARDPVALRELAGRYADLLSTPEACWFDICRAAAVKRGHYRYRLAVLAKSAEEAARRLRAFAQGEKTTGCVAGEAANAAPAVGLMYTGQGSQYIGMGRQLYESEPVFRAALDQCAQVFAAVDVGLFALRGEHVALLEVLFDRDGHGPLLNDTRYAQPALFALEYSLAELWKSWGVKPNAVIGHSLGEYTAAVTAGILTLDDAMRLVTVRARLMSRLPRDGAMAAVSADAAAVAEVVAQVGGRLSIAAYNAPESTVISGEIGSVDLAISGFAARNVAVHRLEVSHAFHSALVEPMRAEFLATAQTVQFAPARTTFFSNLTGEPLPEDYLLSAEYLAEHVRLPVQFHAGIMQMAERCDVLLEVGPGGTLAGLGRRCVTAGDHTWLSSLRPQTDESEQMLGSLASLYARGVDVKWSQVYPGRPQRISLPLYPFQRRHYWANEPIAVQSSAATVTASSPTAHPLIARRLATAVPTWEVEVCREAMPWLWDHRVHGSPWMPAAAWLEAAAAAVAATSDSSIVVEQVTFREPLPLSDDVPTTIQCSILPDGGIQLAGANPSRSGVPSQDNRWRVYAVGRASPGVAASSRDTSVTSLASAQAACRTPVDVAEHYADLGACGLNYGSAFRGLQVLHAGDGESLGLCELPTVCPADARFLMHPALLDAAFHVILATVPRADEAARRAPWIPIGVERYVLHIRHAGKVYSHAVLRPRHDGRTQIVDLRLYDRQGALVAEIVGLTLATTVALPSRAESAATSPAEILELHWREKPLSTATHENAKDRRLIFAAQPEVAMSFAAKLRSRGVQCVTVTAGDKFCTLGPDEYRLRPTVLEEWQCLHAELCRLGRLPRQIIYVSSSRDPAARLSAETLSCDFEAGCLSLLPLIQAFGRQGNEPREVWAVTCGAETIGTEWKETAVAQTAIGGLLRTAAWEYPQLRCRTIDVDPTSSDNERLDHIVAELVADTDDDRLENRVAYRGEARWVARLVSQPTSASNSPRKPEQSQQLRKGHRGLLEDLSLVDTPRRPPGTHEVEIRVRATGLNFRDVLNALDLYPGDAGPLGGECAGTIVAVGAGVKEWKPGDSVMALAAGSFADYVTIPASLVVALPQGCNFSEAATIPIAFLTAWLTLVEIGRLKRGDRVLIHAAAGGVGLAAVQAAQIVGAEVFATVGSTAKRDLLRTLGVRHIANSRTLDFADQFRDVTSGEGVDVVLNALSGEFRERSIELLRPGGRFLEIGKIDLWSAEQFAAVNPRAEYHVFDLAEATQQNPQRIQAALRRIAQRFEQREFRPLPLRATPWTEAAATFRTMAQGKHVGKLVLTPPAEPLASFRADATYLITGGFGGLGLRTAEWMIERGARRLLLVGRRLPSDDPVQEAVKRLQERGAEVVPLQADVADVQRLREVLMPALASRPPLRGVVHAAGILEDGVTEQQSAERFRRVLAAKAVGAVNLHELTREQPLDYFVGFSSIASLVGSPGQSNYAAANAVLDALMQERRRQGLPALSVNWGPWSETGMAARTTRQGASGELPMLKPTAALAALERLPSSTSAQAAVLAANWMEFFARRGLNLPSLLQNASGSAVVPPDSTTQRNLRRRLEAAPADERANLLLDFLRDAAGVALGLPQEQAIDPRRALNELGLDSLMAVELRNKLAGTLGLMLPNTLLFDYPTLEALVVRLLSELFPPTATRTQTRPPENGRAEPAHSASSTEPQSGRTTAEIAALLEAELQAVRTRSAGTRREQPRPTT